MKYQQSTGQLTSDSGAVMGFGYAGHSEGFNNPAMQNVVGVGPLPQGFYAIGRAHESPTTGRITLNLEPDPKNEMFGRSEFRIHGDNPSANHTASDGCIVIGPGVRNSIDEGIDKRLEVVA